LGYNRKYLDLVRLHNCRRGGGERRQAREAGPGGFTRRCFLGVDQECSNRCQLLGDYFQLLLTIGKVLVGGGKNCFEKVGEQRWQARFAGPGGFTRRCFPGDGPGISFHPGFGRVIWRNTQVLGIQGSWFGKTVLKKWGSNDGRPASRAPGGGPRISFLPGFGRVIWQNTQVLGIQGSWFGRPGSLFRGLSWYFQSLPTIGRLFPVVTNYWKGLGRRVKTVLKKWGSNVGRPAKRAPGVLRESLFRGCPGISNRCQLLGDYFQLLITIGKVWAGVLYHCIHTLGFMGIMVCFMGGSWTRGGSWFPLPIRFI